MLKVIVKSQSNLSKEKVREFRFKKTTLFLLTNNENRLFMHLLNNLETKVERNTWLETYRKDE